MKKKKTTLSSRTSLTKQQETRINDLFLGWSKLGWGVDGNRITPKNAVHVLLGLAGVANLSWQNDIRAGRTPPEDISPGEGFLLLAYFVEHVCKLAKVRGVKVRDLIDGYHKKNIKFTDGFEDKIRKELADIAPGYFKEADDGGKDA